MMNFIYSFFNQPAIIVGLITFVGLVALKKPFEKVLTGTMKTIIGFVILSAGGGIIWETIEFNFIPAFESAFNMVGVIPTNEAIIGVAESMFGTEMALIMGFGFLTNIIMARISRFKYIFLSGHMVLFMSGLLAAVLSTLGFVGTEMVVIGTILLGATMVFSPAIVQPFMRQVIGSDDFAMGHYNGVNYSLAAIVSKITGNPDKSTENLKISEKLSFFRDTSITIGIVMIIVFVLSFVFADAEVANELSGGDNIIMYAIMQGFLFTGGFSVVLQGVRMTLAEIVPAFKGISDKLVPNAIPALDVPVIYPYAPNAVLIGFLASTAGALIMFFLLPVFGLPVVLLGDSIFFVGAGAGVLANKTGGARGTIISGIVNGALLVLLPALMLPMMASLGFVGSTFGDADFALVGMLLGLLSNLFGKAGIYGLVVVIFVILIGSNFLPKKKDKEEVEKNVEVY